MIGPTLLSLALATPAAVCADEFLPRSPAQQRTMRSDELRLPRFRERQSHRGWEIRDNHFTVLATTSAEDARWVADQMSEVWEELEGLADHFTEVHRQANFAIGSTLVRVDEVNDEADILRANPRGAATTEVVDLGGQVLIRLPIPGDDRTGRDGTGRDGAGRDEIDSDELLRAQLRHAATYAFLSISQMDQRLPSWTCEGLARYLAQRDLPPDQRAQILERLAAPVRGRQRVGPDQLDDDVLEPARSPDTIQFLLEGDDARHVGDFFDALRATLDEAETATRQRVRPRFEPQSDDEPLASPRLEALADQTESDLARWREDPLSGQPRIETAAPETLDAVLEQRQQRMAFVLKLMQRFGGTRQAGFGGSAARRSRVKVQEFGKPAAAAPAPTVASYPVSLADLYRRLTINQPLWATHAPDGTILYSDDDESMRAWLGDLWNRRYSAERNGANWRLTYRLDDGRTLTGALDDSSPEASRFPVRFEVHSAPDSARETPPGNE